MLKKTRSDNCSARELQALFIEHAEEKNLKELALLGVSLDEEAIESLLSCIEANPLEEVSLATTLLLPESMNQVLATLANHPTLSSLDLSDCVIDNESKEALIQLIRQCNTLKKIDLSGHTLTIDKAFLGALAQSASLTQVKGITEAFPDSLKAHIVQNENFQKLEDYLRHCTKESTRKETSTSIEIKKKIFYKIVDEIQSKPHNVQRLNHVLAAFYLILAQKYQGIDQLELMQKYCDRVLANDQNDLHLYYQAHELLADLYYNQGSDFIQHPQEGSDKAQGEEFLLMAYNHLRQANEYATNQEQDYIKRKMAYCQITLGEHLLSNADQSLNDHLGFKRNYRKMTS